MIKRQFYKMEHGDKDDASAQSSSSSSVSEIQPEPEHDPNSSSGEEGSSADEPTLAHTSDDDDDEGNSRRNDAVVFGKSASRLQQRSAEASSDEESPDGDGIAEYVVKRKATFKCRICPKVVCLNEEAVNTHLKSKRHARSEKLLNNGQLKTVLNIDGKLDEEDTPALYARILAAPQPNPRKRSKQDDKRKPRKKRMR